LLDFGFYVCGTESFQFYMAFNTSFYRMHKNQSVVEGGDETHQNVQMRVQACLLPRE